MQGSREVSDPAWDLRSMKTEYWNSSAGYSGGWPPVGGEGVRSQGSARPGLCGSGRNP